MNEFKCSVVNCAKPATEGCGTCNKTSCPIHSHLTSCPPNLIQNIFIEISGRIKSKHIFSLSSVVCQCSNLRSELLKSSSNLIEKILKETQILTKTLNDLEKSSLSLIQQLQIHEKVQIYQNQIPEEQNLVKLLKLGEKHEIFEKVHYFSPDFLQVLLKDSQESFINSTPYQHSISYMAFFARNSSTLTLYHIKDNTFKTEKTFEKMPERAGWCYLPDGKIFHFGGRKDGNVGITCLINPSTKSVNFLKKGPELRNVGQLTYYKGEVYVFGGFSKQKPSSSVLKYSLMEDLWVNLNEMPVPSESCCSCFYGNSIIVTGENMQGVFNYDRGNNSFKVLMDLETGFKVVWSANGRCFVLIKNCIYESGIFNKYCWSSYIENGSTVNQTRLMAPTVKRGEEVFILFENRQLYSFHLEKRRITFVTEITKFS